MQRTGVDAVPRHGAAALAHRHDVDGLRAVAVLAILAFHLDVAGFRGGFVGVDIFFVISGYVILRSILPDLENGRFSLADFFIRRLRRIVPALTVVLALTLAAGLVILTPDELGELAGSALATIAFGANFFFHDRTGYFAPSAHTRPLLHMWSLGIEEQFYIIVPVTLAALARLRGVAAAKPLVILAVGSFVYCLVATTMAEKHAFYMPVARFWEIAVGGCVAVAERRWGLLRKGADWVAVLGLLAVAATVVLLDSETGGQRWVGVAVLGTAAVIAAGGPGGSWAAAALASTPMVAVGRISYSIYLVHWPLIVLWRLCVVRPLLLHEQVLIAVVTLIAAAALSASVETPMRAGARRIGNRPALTGLFTANTVLAAVGAALIMSGGAPWRLNGPASGASETLRAAVAQQPRCRDDRQPLAVPFRVCRWNPEVPGTDFVIWGDSHARVLAPELARALGKAGQSGGVSVGLSACPPLAGVALAERATDCPKLVDAALDLIKREKPRLVAMIGRWALLASDVPAPGDKTKSVGLVDLENGRAPIQFADALIRTIERVKASGAEVVLVGPVPEIDYHVPTALVRSLNGIGRLPAVLRADFDLRQKQVMAALGKVGTLRDVVVVYPHTVLCNEATCAVADGSRALYVDDDHLSPFGAARVSALVKSAIDRSRTEITKSNRPSSGGQGE
jgi:peptidoglycan/LPS O-acetylase OafA/YrhL